MMTTFPPDMATKEWTPDEVRELVDMAKGRGVSQRKLAAEYIGCTVQSLVNWLTPGNGIDPSEMARNAMSYAEIRIRRLKEKE